MNRPQNMIENTIVAKRDRLSAFFEAFELTVTVAPAHVEDATANLFVTGGSNGNVEHIIFYARNAAPAPSGAIVVAANVEFGGAMNPLLDAMPERFVIIANQVPTLDAVTAAFVAEALDNRCGRQVALNRLCEVLVLMVLRRAIDVEATGLGLLAGLSHPALHRAIVAMHDQPSRTWHIEDLAEISGMSRSRFMTLFPKVVGMTPAAYLTSWRLALGRRELSRGGRVKSVARRVGFGSAAAFSRAHSRAFGHPPKALRDSQSHS
jgi:AraC-like DNA-binding protein